MKDSVFPAGNQAWAIASISQDGQRESPAQNEAQGFRKIQNRKIT
jgi:hypothetical protein